MPLRPGQPERRRGYLPIPLTPMIGRDNDLDDISRLVSNARLTTLVGPGGVGKTRLAVAVGLRHQDRRADGVWLIDLAAADGTHVAATIAMTLGVDENRHQPMLETLVAALGRRAPLLLLDNCEHVIDSSAMIIAALLTRCPDVAVLATSREPLGVPGEQVWPVAPLLVPDAESNAPASQIAQLPSVRLFCERALATRPSFHLSDQQTALVGQICRQLDGLPLGIELAAARVASLGVEQIAARLTDRFRLLTSGSRTAPPRHQTLRATLDWGYDLLEPAERTALRRLAVFIDGWTLEAAEQVLCGAWQTSDVVPEDQRDQEIVPHDVLDLLDRLVQKSFVRVDHHERPGQTESAARFRLLETVRHYASERLAGAGEVAAGRARHAGWCAALAEAAEPHLLGREQAAWLARLDEEHNNMRAALVWCARYDPDLGLRIAAALWQFWRIRLLLGEGRGALSRLLASAPAPTPVRARALAAAGVLAAWQLDADAGHQLLGECAELARRLGDRALLGRALRELGALYAARLGDPVAASRFFQEGIEFSRAAGDRRSVATNLQQQARLAMTAGAFREAQRLLDESLRLLADVGDLWQLAIVLDDAAGVALALGDADRALALCEESVETAHALEVAGVRTLHRRFHPGSVAYWRGDGEEAAAWYEAGLAMTREREHFAGVADNLAGLGLALVAQGQAERARVLLEESLDIAMARADRAGQGRARYGLGLVELLDGASAAAAAPLRESLRVRWALNDLLGTAVSLEALAAATLDTVSDPESSRRVARWLDAADALRARLSAPRAPVDNGRYRQARAVVPARSMAAGVNSRADGDADDLVRAVIDALGQIEATDGTPGPAPASTGDAAPVKDQRRLESPASGAGLSDEDPAEAESRPSTLSRREFEVLRLMAAGHTNGEIAAILSVSANTVRHHVTHILDKTGCENRAAATAFAYRHGLV